jgi:hypothetical protein
MYDNKSFPYLHELNQQTEQYEVIVKSSTCSKKGIALKPLVADTFFVESIHDMHFLRHTENRLFCNLVSIKTEKITTQKGEINFDLLTVHFEFEERLLAINSTDEGLENFVSFFFSKEDFNNIPNSLQDLYLSALLLSDKEMRHLDFVDASRKSKLQTNSAYPQPTGRWESSMFSDVFNDDPNSMTDDEYEMIFGDSR